MSLKEDWSAATYLRFEDERTRPSADLLARVPVDAPASIVDLGCGPGNSTELLVRRFPQAEVTGLDSSPDMLAAARRRLPDVAFVEADLAAWSPDRAPDVVFANAVLQWLPDHEALFPRLMRAVAPGGALAVQMPDNLAEPSHAVMREVARDGDGRSGSRGPRPRARKSLRARPISTCSRRSAHRSTSGAPPICTRSTEQRRSASG